MAEDRADELMSRLEEDDELLERFQREPVAVIGEFEIELDADQRGRLEAIDWLELELEEIRARLSGGGGRFWF